MAKTKKWLKFKIITIILYKTLKLPHWTLQHPVYKVVKRKSINSIFNHVFNKNKQLAD